MRETLIVKPLTASDRIIQAFSVAPTGLLTVARRSTRIWQLRDGDIVKGRETSSSGVVQLALAYLDRDNSTVLVTVVSNPRDVPWTYHIAMLSAGDQVDRETLIQVPEYGPVGSSSKKEILPRASNFVPFGAHSCRLGCVVSLYQGWLHALTIASDVAGSPAEVMTGKHNFSTAAADQFQGGKSAQNSGCFTLQLQSMMGVECSDICLQETALYKAWPLSQQVSINKPSFLFAWCPSQVCRHALHCELVRVNSYKAPMKCLYAQPIGRKC